MVDIYEADVRDLFNKHRVAKTYRGIMPKYYKTVRKFRSKQIKCRFLKKSIILYYNPLKFNK